MAELNRQRERASLVICTLNADVYGFGELENTTPSASITDLLGAVNTLCGGAHPYAFVNTGGTLGTDAIRVQLIYRTGVLSPVGSPLSDLDAIHSRPPTAQTFDVVDAANPAFGKRFTVIANHFKSKGSSAGLPGDADAGDGAGCLQRHPYRPGDATAHLGQLDRDAGGRRPRRPPGRRLQLLRRGDPDHDDHRRRLHRPRGALLGPTAYSYLFDGQLGHLDYAFSSASLTPQITGVGAWHINADEADLLDYNDEIKDVGEAAFEEKPDGSALVPPRVLFQPATPYRASDHDPVIVGIFKVADLGDHQDRRRHHRGPGRDGHLHHHGLERRTRPPPPGSTVADTFPASLTCSTTCVGAGGGTCTAGPVAGNINDTVNLPVGGSVTYTASCTIAGTATGNAGRTPPR